MSWCLTRLHTRSQGMTATTRSGSRRCARKVTCWCPRPGNKPRRMTLMHSAFSPCGRRVGDEGQQGNVQTQSRQEESPDATPVYPVLSVADRLLHPRHSAHRAGLSGQCRAGGGPLSGADDARLPRPAHWRAGPAAAGTLGHPHRRAEPPAQSAAADRRPRQPAPGQRGSGLPRGGQHRHRRRG